MGLFDAFEHLFPIVLLVLWVIVKATAPRRRNNTSTINHKAESENSGAGALQNRPKESAKSLSESQMGSKSLYDSMKKALEEYFGELPAEMPPGTEVKIEKIEYRYDGKQKPSQSTEEEEVVSLEDISEEEEAPVTATTAASTIEPSCEHAAPYFALPLAGSSSKAIAPSLTAMQPPTTVGFAEGETLQKPHGGAAISNIDLRTAVVWSEILAPPLALRE